MQILQSVVYKYIDISGRNTCTLVSSPVLDTVYPYGGSTLNKPGDSTVDGPGKGLAPSRGRVSRVFQRYNVPDVDFTGPYRPYPVPEWKCLPVPRGNVDWSWWGDATNTQINNPNSDGSPLRKLTNGSPGQNPAFSEDYSFPTWTSVWISGQSSDNCVAGG